MSDELEIEKRVQEWKGKLEGKTLISQAAPQETVCINCIGIKMIMDRGSDQYL